VTPQRSQSSILSQSVRLSFENIVVLVVAVIMGLIISFSFGVEMGRRTHTPVKTSSEPVRISRQADEQDDEGPAGDDAPGMPLTAGSPAEVQITESTPILAESHIETSQNHKNPDDFKKKVDKIQALEKIHTIQVASFKQENLADVESETLKKIGYDAFTVRKGSYWIVCVGRFPDLRGAQPLFKALKKKYSDCYIRSL